MKTNVEYIAILAREFKRFSFDLNLCSPCSLRITEAQFTQLMNELIVALHPHSHLNDLPLLKLTIQAINIEEDVFVNEHMRASIDIFTPYSPIKMASFEAQIFPEEITVKLLYLRPIQGIRKSSLFGEPEEKNHHPKENALVFIVDDTPLVLKTLKNMISALNPDLTVRTFNDGSEIIQAYSNPKNYYFVPPKLIFMDLQMSGLNGFEASQEIRAQEKKFQLTPTIITALTAMELPDSTILLKCGINTFLPKPFVKAGIQNQLIEVGLLKPIQIVPIENYESTDNADSAETEEESVINNAPSVPDEVEEMNVYLSIINKCVLF